jgi:hypothetical protein
MAQQAPIGVEHDFAVYGRNPTTKQVETRRKNLADGKAVGKLANRRMIGLLKMIRNMAFAHRSQHVQHGRFTTEDEVRVQPYLALGIHCVDYGGVPQNTHALL